MLSKMMCISFLVINMWFTHLLIIKLRICNISHQDITLSRISKRINISSENREKNNLSHASLQVACVYVSCLSIIYESDIEVRETFIFMTKQVLVLLSCHQQYLPPVNMTEIFHWIPCFTRRTFHSSFHPSRRSSLDILHALIFI